MKKLLILGNLDANGKRITISYSRKDGETSGKADIYQWRKLPIKTEWKLVGDSSAVHYLRLVITDEIIELAKELGYISSDVKLTTVEDSTGIQKFIRDTQYERKTVNLESIKDTVAIYHERVNNGDLLDSVLEECRQTLQLLDISLQNELLYRKFEITKPAIRNYEENFKYVFEGKLNSKYPTHVAEVRAKLTFQTTFEHHDNNAVIPHQALLRLSVIHDDQSCGLSIISNDLFIDGFTTPIIKEVSLTGDNVEMGDIHKHQMMVLQGIIGADLMDLNEGFIATTLLASIRCHGRNQKKTIRPVERLQAKVDDLISEIERQQKARLFKAFKKTLVAGATFTWKKAQYRVVSYTNPNKNIKLQWLKEFAGMGATHDEWINHLIHIDTLFSGFQWDELVITPPVVTTK